MSPRLLQAVPAQAVQQEQAAELAASPAPPASAAIETQGDQGVGVKPGEGLEGEVGEAPAEPPAEPAPGEDGVARHRCRTKRKPDDVDPAMAGNDNQSKESKPTGPDPEAVPVAESAEPAEPAEITCNMDFEFNFETGLVETLDSKNAHSAPSVGDADTISIASGSEAASTWSLGNEMKRQAGGPAQGTPAETPAKKAKVAVAPAAVHAVSLKTCKICLEPAADKNALCWPHKRALDTIRKQALKDGKESKFATEFFGIFGSGREPWPDEEQVTKVLNDFLEVYPDCKLPTTKN